MNLPPRSDLLEVVAGWSEVVDRAIAAGVEAEVERLADWPEFEWHASLDEFLKLSKGADVYYDRPTVGPAYALWYHARRVNPLVSQMERILRTTNENGQEGVNIVDLGAGTGALAWAALLVANAIETLGGQAPMTRVHEVESSSLMSAAADSLWRAIGAEFDARTDVVRVPLAVSWPNARINSDAPVWLLASYLLDHTDRHRIDEMAKALHRVVDQCQAEGVVFTVTRSKREVADSAVSTLARTHEWDDQLRQASLVWNGPLVHAAATRRRLYASVGMKADPLLKRPPTFDGDNNPSVREARRPAGPARELFPEQRWMPLTDEQSNATSIDVDRSGLLLGAAGSGKSIVLVERIGRLVERSRLGLPRRALVTTFNKDMLDQLDAWIGDRLRHGGHRYRRADDRGHVTYFDVGAGRDQIELLNWDKAPSRLAACRPSTVQETKWRRVAAGAASRLMAEDERFASLHADDRVADPRFLLTELRRVKYGLGALTRDAYMTVERRGRGLPLGRVQRDFVWSVLEEAPERFTWVGRRIEMLKAVRSGSCSALYTDVFVDEAQDFLPADVECLLAVHDGTGAAFYVVDETQALHIGRSYVRPAHPVGNWQAGTIVRLEGSHRLPVPIARCVRPVAEAARSQRRQEGRAEDDISLPESRKAAVIGVRPIVVVGDLDHLATQIRRIADTYQGYLAAERGATKNEDAVRVTICENDPGLASAVGDGLDVESTTVKKIKGLEREFVAWSTRKALGDSEEALELSYTVMTRASCLLVIAIDPRDLPEEHHEVLECLDADQLMLWDQSAATWWEAHIAS